MGCGIPINTCSDQIYQFNDSFTVGWNTKEIATNEGTFKNPFELSFNGSVADSSSGLAISILGDIRDACGSGTAGEVIHHEPGTIYVMPEIGIIQMEYMCIASSGKTVTYTLTLDDTNINF